SADSQESAGNKTTQQESVGKKMFAQDEAAPSRSPSLEGFSLKTKNESSLGSKGRGRRGGSVTKFGGALSESPEHGLKSQGAFAGRSVSARATGSSRRRKGKYSASPDQSSAFGGTGQNVGTRPMSTKASPSSSGDPARIANTITSFKGVAGGGNSLNSGSASAGHDSEIDTGAGSGGSQSAKSGAKEAAEDEIPAPEWSFLCTYHDDALYVKIVVAHHTSEGSENIVARRYCRLKFRANIANVETSLAKSNINKICEAYSIGSGEQVGNPGVGKELYQLKFSIKNLMENRTRSCEAIYSRTDGVIKPSIEDSDLEPLQ
ncbi:hypothetical protein ACFL6Y_02145, partial [Elusimicrobiota bacterium]